MYLHLSYSSTSTSLKEVPLLTVHWAFFFSSIHYFNWHSIAIEHILIYWFIIKLVYLSIMYKRVDDNTASSLVILLPWIWNGWSKFIIIIRHFSSKLAAQKVYGTFTQAVDADWILSILFFGQLGTGRSKRTKQFITQITH